MRKAVCVCAAVLGGRLARLAGVALLALTACARHGDPPVDRRTASPPAHADAAADARRAALVALPLGPRTFDLAHVDVPPLAAALHRDPDAIFVFVRDQIRFESYRGILRGPRGTLLALAGNSVDRAALLAGLLTSAGQRVRFAHGTLPEPAAQRLVDTMWSARPTAVTRDGTAVAAGGQAAMDRLYAGVKRDYAALHAALLSVTPPAAPDPAAQAALLLSEARDHYWVQLAKGDAWVDLDPSFADAAPGHSYAPLDRTMAALPDSLAHRLTIRVRVEERTGDEVASRTVLTFAAKTADLSASDIVLLHMPDKWSPQQGPANALAASAGPTGQLRPVLLVGTASVAGAAFRQAPAPAAGMGGVLASLAGEGTRHATPIAIAESIDFEVSAPGERVRTVTREVFDRLGAARRTSGSPLAAELQPADGDGALAGRLFFLFVTTGGIDASHVAGVGEAADPVGASRFATLRARLRRVQTLFTVSSDAIVAAVGGEAHPILFYPDSPRIQILELSMDGEVPRLSLDLRRDSVRAVARPSHPGSVFFAQVLRGVVEGSLERALLEYVTAASSTADAPLIMSTSLVFERASAHGVPLALLSRDVAVADASADALARVHADLADGYLAFAPRQAIRVTTAPRWGWWRIDPHTGDTVAVTDEGLHQAVEMHMQHDRARGETTIVFYEYVEDTRVVNLATQNGATFRSGSIEMGRYLGALLSNPDLVWFETVI